MQDFIPCCKQQICFHGKIDGRYLESYCAQHSSVDAIIPNILIHNYKDASGNNRNACSMPAIIDVKTLRVDKNQTIYKAGIVHGGRVIMKALKKKSDQVRTEYETRVGKLDNKFATSNDQHDPSILI